MNFRFAFSTPTNYVNCQNYTAHGNGRSAARTTRAASRSRRASSTIAQVTVHMDHPFWESFAEDTPVHWDQIAAQYVGVDAARRRLHRVAHRGLQAASRSRPSPTTTGTPLPWRNCSGPNYTPPGNGQMFFSTLSVPGLPAAAPTRPTCIRDYYDYIRYTQSTQGHLNSQGLCFIDRQFPRPPAGRERVEPGRAPGEA